MQEKLIKFDVAFNFLLPFLFSQFFFLELFFKLCKVHYKNKKNKKNGH